MKKKIEESLEIAELDKVAGGLDLAPNESNMNNKLRPEYSSRKFTNRGLKIKDSRFVPSILLENNSF